MHPNSLKVVISIKESEDLCKKISNIYEFIGELEEKQNSETYNADYSIIKANEHFSEKNVESDGFIYKHRLFLNEKRARKT